MQNNAIICLPIKVLAYYTIGHCASPGLFYTRAEPCYFRRLIGIESTPIKGSPEAPALSSAVASTASPPRAHSSPGEREPSACQDHEGRLFDHTSPFGGTPALAPQNKVFTTARITQNNKRRGSGRRVGVNVAENAVEIARVGSRQEEINITS